MRFLDLLLEEMEQEAKTTRKMLAAVPTDKFDWQPHPKSMTVKALATHIAELPAWVHLVLNTTELDFATAPYHPPVVHNMQDLFNLLETSLQQGRQALQQAQEEQLAEKWALRHGETIYANTTKAAFIRTTFCQIVHHRAQLGVFLRLLDRPIPASYGPSADDPSFA